MIEKGRAAQEIGRLLGLDYFPTDQKAIKELVTALTFSATDAIATGVINEWLEDQKQRPTPADLRRIIANHNEVYRESLKQDAERVPASYGCGKCRDTGIVGGHIGTKHDSGWEWCGCMATWRRQKDDPGLIEESNRLRDGLIARLGKKPIRGMVRAHLDSQYFGEF